MATLRERLGQPGSFLVAAELVTGHGPLGAPSGAAVLELARALADDPRIDVLSITENPGGTAMLAPEALALDARERGQETIVPVSYTHLTLPTTPYV